MNERIKELAKQCSHTFDSYDFEYGWSTHEYFDKEKFAELIVLDCVKICVDNGESYKHHFTLTSDLIKHHFGVKE